ncbi:MAG: hypothetical protein CVV64_19980 [Candidatus Wallbacteria bacterium HGW-Wallbacteria-1]|uniref:Uncharacterized protein n=1 Tax=Candidatus Wallbacteria bacterium HGW-Wallbacteria-1 TaxID=2013854 RepID=A0A2N1PIN8_9BACT|nr:MAG: hypothetical protein CVV64_19980 [Candidatus Wallbacteria bacterium HGW-Wallbacteria-1]
MFAMSLSKDQAESLGEPGRWGGQITVIEQGRRLVQKAAEPQPHRNQPSRSREKQSQRIASAAAGTDIDRGTLPIVN